MRKLVLLLLLVTNLTGCAQFLYQPEQARQWPDLGLHIAVIVVPDVGEATVRQRRFIVRSVRPDTPAQRAGVLAGDILVSLDDRVIISASDALDVMRSKTRIDNVILTVQRAGKTLVFTADLLHAALRSSI